MLSFSSLFFYLLVDIVEVGSKFVVLWGSLLSLNEIELTYRLRFNLGLESFIVDLGV